MIRTTEAALPEMASKITRMTDTLAPLLMLILRITRMGVRAKTQSISAFRVAPT